MKEIFSQSQDMTKYVGNDGKLQEEHDFSGDIDIY